ncbi:hypothetical protein VPNG_02790 [Cytospora leucostoma]|uniref:C2H2-type domain-containing protein n=1 Tax=Cytospora leucostoma TaxID=1230097 RepID=A0A423XJE7_9PEZI|nr:hypothetical protein VPNG_02790 [Cytospora leucostoma]
MAPLQAADFINPLVTNAPNPSSYGYHHGPIPNNNHGWVPPRHQYVNGKLPELRVSDVANAPNPGVRLSFVNTLICDIDVNGGEMCGEDFNEQDKLRRHLRTCHPGAVTAVTGGPINPKERTAGVNALTRWVLLLGWRNARYRTDPYLGTPVIADICNNLERLAAEDPAFAARYGRHFHRRVPHWASADHVPFGTLSLQG